MISLRPATDRSIDGNMIPPSPLYQVNAKTGRKIDFPDSFFLSIQCRECSFTDCDDKP